MNLSSLLNSEERTALTLTTRPHPTISHGLTGSFALVKHPISKRFVSATSLAPRACLTKHAISYTRPRVRTHSPYVKEKMYPAPSQINVGETSFRKYDSIHAKAKCVAGSLTVSPSDSNAELSGTSLSASSSDIPFKEAITTLHSSPSSLFQIAEPDSHMYVRQEDRKQDQDSRPFKCTLCSNRFLKKDHATKHWRVVHLKQRPFPCPSCNSRFGQRSDLTKHINAVHLRLQPFQCPQCLYRFSHRGNLLRHKAVVHEKKKPFVCEHCGVAFAEKSNLRKHCQAVHKTSMLTLSR